ncbi:MAG: phosphate ABC transporter permease subunit PstC [Clostridia bacterium]
MNSSLKSSKSSNFLKESLGRTIVSICGIAIILLTIAIAAFLFYKGSFTFTVQGHNIMDLIFSAEWEPANNANTVGEGEVGALIFIAGSFYTCGLALLIAIPFSLAAAIFLAEIASDRAVRIVRPAVEIFVGIPSVIYGWVGYKTIVPAIKAIFGGTGSSVLAAGIVLAIMIFPTITTVATDAMKSVPMDFRSGAYGLGSTRWQVIRKVVLPSANPGILTGIILGLARAFGEALAVGMVVGRMRAFAEDVFSPTHTITTAISSEMGNSIDGSELNSALWSLALVLFVVAIVCILAIHAVSKKAKVDE